MKFCLVLLLSMTTNSLLAQSASFWNSYPSSNQTQQNTSSQASNECQWREREITITILGNDEVWVNADIITTTCDIDGKPLSYGDYVRIENRGKSSFFYRSSPPGTYENPNTKVFQRGTSSNAYYFELGPGEARIVDVVDGRNQKDKYLPTHAVLNVKYCKPSSYPTQAGLASLQRYKTSQQQYNTNSGVSQIGSSNSSLSCSRYYVAVIEAEYHTYDSNYQLTSGHLHIYVSDVFKSSVKIAGWFNGSAIQNDKSYLLPQCMTNDTKNLKEAFTNQNFLMDIDIPKNVQGSDIACFNYVTFFWGDTKEEVEAIQKKYETIESYQQYIRPSYTGVSGYKKFSGNSAFTFNKDVVCLEN